MRAVMPQYYFKLVDSHIVVDYGVHELLDETVAQIEALKLARSIRNAQPELLGQALLHFRHSRGWRRHLPHAN
jgi:hypothetical protein